LRYPKIGGCTSPTWIFSLHVAVPLTTMLQNIHFDPITHSLFLLVLGIYNPISTYPLCVQYPSPHPPTPTTPLLPNLPTTPLPSPKLLSISPSSTPLSLITKTCLNVTTSRNVRPSLPFLPILANSLSASSARRYRAVNRLTAGFSLPPSLFPVGKILCSGFDAEGWNCGAKGFGLWEEEGEGWEIRSGGARRWEEVLKVEEFDMVGLGDTGPSWRIRALRRRSGSEESRSIAIYRK
jgi:hypothetical protein